MATYNYITKTQAIQQIANRLYDPTMQFWTSFELGLYLNEALRTWNALTSYWRGDFTFSSNPNARWYDLTNSPLGDLSPSMPNTLRPYTVTDAELYQLIEYHLLEPPVALSSPWSGSLQFQPADITAAVGRRRDELRSITGCTLTHFTLPAVAGRISFAASGGDGVIDVRRMAYMPSSLFPLQKPSVVWPDDTWAEQSFDRLYTLNPAGTPLTYLMSTQPPISFDTNRPPAYSGTYEFLTVDAGATLDPDTPRILYVPDDWTHVIKWGALADLLSRESNSTDLPRAAYCEQRYRLGIAAMMSAPALLAMRVNNVPLQIDSVHAADLYDTGWQGIAPTTPTKCLHAGLNLIALPGLGLGGAYGAGLYGAGVYGGASALTYSFTATVVENAPLPTLAADPVQVSRDDLDAIIDCAQHLAAFKQGGEEFTRSIPLFQRFLKQAAIYNGKLAELGEYSSMLLDLSQRENDMNPVLTPDAQKEAASSV